MSRALSSSRARLYTALAVSALTTVRLAIAGSVGLGDAEAYYWTWAQEPALGYLDHGPVVAWLITASTALFGNTTFAIRLPFILCSALTLWLLAVHAARVDGHWRAGWIAMLLLIAMPMFMIAGGAANPDVPFVLIVVLLLVVARTAMAQPRLRWAVLAGVLVGVSLNTKLFGIALLLPLLAIAWGTHPRGLSLAVAALSAGIASLPVMLWNAQQSWPSLRYHLLQRHADPVGPSLLNLAKLIGGQIGYVSPFVLAGLLAAGWVAYRERAEPAMQRVLLFALPLLVGGYLLILIVPGAEPHWPSAGYVALVPLLAQLLPSWRARQRTVVRVGVLVTVALAALVGLAFHLHILTDLGVRVMPSTYVPRYDLSNELYGWPRVADRMAHAIARYEREDRPTLAAGCHYTTCAQLRFAAGGRFEVVCPSPRTDQFDYFRGGDGAGRHGVTLLYLRDERFPFDAALLYRCRDVRREEAIAITRGGRVVRRFVIERCIGFGGLRQSHWPPRPFRASAAAGIAADRADRRRGAPRSEGDPRTHGRYARLRQ